MGTPDVITKTYMSDNRIFADACNCLFGKRVVEADNLESLDPTELFVSGKNTQILKAKQKQRDLIKRMAVKKDDKAIYVLLGIENQTLVDYAMPVRILLYDALRYDKQVNEIKSKNKGRKPNVTSDSFVSGFQKNDILMPVITFVVYYGEKPWDGPKSLYDMLPSGIDSSLLSQIQNYAISIVEPARLSDEELSRLSTSLREVFTFLKYQSDDEKLEQAIITDPAFKSLDRLAVDVINSVSNNKLEYSEQEEKINVCTAITKMIEKCEAKCEAKSLKEKIESIKRFIDLKVDYNTIAAGLGLSVDEVKRLAAS